MGVGVALTRGRDTNEVYLYERRQEEADHHHRDDPAPDGVYLAQRDGPAQAARMLRHIVGRDHQARTAHHATADTPARQLSPLWPAWSPNTTTPSPNGTLTSEAQRAQRIELSTAA